MRQKIFYRSTVHFYFTFVHITFLYLFHLSLSFSLFEHSSVLIQYTFYSQLFLPSLYAYLVLLF